MLLSCNSCSPNKCIYEVSGGLRTIPYLLLGVYTTYTLVVALVNGWYWCETRRWLHRKEMKQCQLWKETRRNSHQAQIVKINLCLPTVSTILPVSALTLRDNSICFPPINWRT